MRRHTKIKSLISVMSIALVLVFVFMAFGEKETYSLTADRTLSATDESKFMKYMTSMSNGFDIQGAFTKVDSDSSSEQTSMIRTTYSDQGYEVYLKTPESGQYQISNYANGDVVTQDGIDFQMKFEFIENGRSVRINYILQNNNSSAKTAQIATSGDTMVGWNDSAAVTKTKTNGTYLFKMVDDNMSNDTYGAEFKLQGDFDTAWIGYFGDRSNNLYNNSSGDSVSGLDSGLAYSWTVNMQAGETVTKSCIFKIDSMLELGDCEVAADVANERFTVKAPYSYEKGKTLQLWYSIDDSIYTQYPDSSTVPAGGEGSFDDVIIDVSSFNWQPETNHKIKFYIVDNANSKVKTRTLDYQIYWPPTTHEGETLKTLKFAEAYTLFADIKNKEGASITLPSDSQPGYAFLGWNTSKDGNGTSYKAGDVYTMTDSDTQYLYAQWIPAYKATVGVYLNNMQQSDSENVNITLVNDTYGTYQNDVAVPNATYKIYVNGADTGKTITVNNAPATAQLNFYTVNLDPHSGTLPEGVEALSVVMEGNKYTIPSDIPVRQCYIFDGWYNNNTKVTGEFTVNSRVDLYAGWTSNHQYGDYKHNDHEHYLECSVCGNIIMRESHEFGEYVYNFDATPEKNGTQTRKCEVCEYEEITEVYGTKEIAALRERIVSEYNDITSKSSVTSDDKSMLNDIISQAQAILQDSYSSQYLKPEDITKLSDIKSDSEKKIEKIENIENTISSFGKHFSEMPEISVINNSYYNELKEINSDINDFIKNNSDSLTESQKEYLGQITDSTELLTERLDLVNDLKSEINNGNKNIPDIDSCKLSDKDNAEAVKEKSDELLKKYSGNLIDSDIKEVEDIILAADEKIARIDAVKNMVDAVKSDDSKIADINNVKTDDKEYIEELKNTTGDILKNYSGNLTDEQKKTVEDIISGTSEKLARIDNFTNAYQNIEEKFSNIPDTEVINSDNEASVKELIASIDDIFDNYSGNINDVQAAELERIRQQLNDRLAKITEVKESEENVSKAYETLPETDESKSSDKETIENTKKQAEEVLAKYADNLTSTEKAELEDIIKNLEEKLAKIDETGKARKAAVEAASELPSADESKSTDKKAAEDAKKQAEEVLAKYAGNLTDEEKAELEDIIKSSEEKLAKIDETGKARKAAEEAASKLPSADESKSTDKEAAENAKKQAEEVLAKYDGNLTDEEKAELKDVIKGSEEKLAKISETEDSRKAVEEVSSKLPSADESKSTDKNSIEDAKKQAEEVLAKYDGNLTDDEKAELEDIIKSSEEKLAKIDETEELRKAAVEAASKLPSVDESKSTDKEAAEDAKKQAEDILTKYAGNLTGDEKSVLEDIVKQAEEKLAKIDETEKARKAAKEAASKLPSVDESKSTDKEAAEDAKKQAEEVLAKYDGNLTDEEKAELKDVIKGSEEKLAKISETEDSRKAVEEVSSKLPSADESKSTDKNSIEDAKKQAEEVLEKYDGNLTSEEKAVLYGMIEDANKRLDIIMQTEMYRQEVGYFYASLPETSVIKTENKDDIVKMKNQAEEIISKYAGNITIEEKAALDDIIKNADEKLAKISEVEKVQTDVENASSSIPDIGAITSDDKAKIEKVKAEAERILSEYADNLTEAEKKALEDKIKDIDERLAKLAEMGQMPATGDTSNLYMWILAALISGMGVMSGFRKFRYNR